MTLKVFNVCLLAQALERMMSPTGSVPHSAISECPTIPVLQEAQASGTPNSPSGSLYTSVFKQPNGSGKTKNVL